MSRIALILPVLISIASAGERTLVLPNEIYNYVDLKLPAHFDERLQAGFDTTERPVTNEGATLGRVLFYDTRISANGAVSCASCHQQEHGFADPLRFSQGFEGHLSDRNSMQLVNLRYNRTGFFWDERARTLLDAVTRPIHNRIEMGMSPEHLEKHISKDPNYAPLFESAFGDPVVTTERITLALEQFVRSLVSTDSRYDRAAAKALTFREPFADFTDEENRGKQLFVNHCAICHAQGTGQQMGLFTIFNTLNNGIDGTALTLDAGRGDITFDPTEIGLFRPGSLRNIEHTAPYMHDGRFATLDEVVEHYSSGIRRHPLTGPVRRLQLDQVEKDSLIAFLKTLTDETFLHDPKFSDPWRDVGEGRTRPSVDTFPPLTASVDGLGIPSNKTLPWVLESDANHDRSLSIDEQRDLAKRLEPLEIFSLYPDFRSFDRRPRPQPPEDPRADFNTDGEISADEAQCFASYKNLIELGDGIRGEVRYDRVLARFKLQPTDEQDARKLLRSTKSAMNATISKLDNELLKELKSHLTEEQFEKFQTLTIVRRLDQNRIRPALKKEDLLDKLKAFDTDSSGSLSPRETRQLAKALGATAGGLAAAKPERITIEQFLVRLMRYDTNQDSMLDASEIPERLGHLLESGDATGDGLISGAELTDYIRDTSFDQFMREGVYVGGGFDNLLALSAPLVLELGLSGDVVELLTKRFATHRKNIDTLVAETLDRTVPSFTSIVSRSTNQEILEVPIPPAD